MNFAWFASAYDTDDWLYRLTTMVQMVGVLVLAIGLPAMFASLEHGDHLDNRTMVFGYVIMRVAMIAQWVRASKEHVERRETCRRYPLLIAIAQVLWVVIAIFDMPILPAFALITVGGIFELMIPAIAERKGRTPWHPHHIAERYFLLTIIALGEVLVGTVTTLSSDVEANGWSFGTALCGFGGVAITFGLWWAYGLLPSGEILASRTDNSYLWGYLHIVLFGSVAATGAGLHVAAYYLAGEASIPEWLAVLAVAVPVAVFLITIMVIYNVLLPADVPHILRTLAVMVLLGVAVWLATFGVPVSWCIVVIALVPAVLIIIDEVSGADDWIDRLQQLT